MARVTMKKISQVKVSSIKVKAPKTEAKIPAVSVKKISGQFKQDNAFGGALRDLQIMKLMGMRIKQAKQEKK